MRPRSLKQQRTRRFDRDVERLAKKGHAEEFASAVREKFMPAAREFVADPGGGWPKGLRVKRVVGAPGVWEFTWSMKDPDGRATFQWMTIEGQPAIRWRRVGDHSVFSDP